jgi:hypothetical protein
MNGQVLFPWIYCASIVILWDTICHRFRWYLKPRKFKSKEIELVHSLLVPVFKIMNSKFHGSLHFAETKKMVPTNKSIE